MMKSYAVMTLQIKKRDGIGVLDKIAKKLIIHILVIADIIIFRI